MAQSAQRLRSMASLGQLPTVTGRGGSLRIGDVVLVGPRITHEGIKSVSPSGVVIRRRRHPNPRPFHISRMESGFRCLLLARVNDCHLPDLRPIHATWRENAATRGNPRCAFLEFVLSRSVAEGQQESGRPSRRVCKRTLECRAISCSDGDWLSADARVIADAIQYSPGTSAGQRRDCSWSRCGGGARIVWF